MFDNLTIYKDLMKAVHPDLHPEIKDATKKAQLVNVNKDNPVALRKLGIEWGFIIPTTEEHKRIVEKQKTKRVNTFFVRPIVTLSVKDLVVFMTGKFVGHKGVVVDISSMKMGKFNGYRYFCVYINSIDKFIDVKIKEYNNISSVLRKIKVNAEDVDLIREAIFKWAVHKNNGYSSLSDLDLRSNRDYEDDNIFIQFKLGEKMHVSKLIRTTNKCVVVNISGTPKLIKVSNIVKRMS